MIPSIQIAVCCYAEVSVVKAQDHPAWHGLIKGLQLLSSFSSNVHENQRQNQTLFPVQRRKEHQQCMPRLFTTCVWGVAINHQAKHNHFSKRQKKKIQAYPPFCSLADCTSFHPTLSQICFPYSAKDSQSPDSSLFFSHSSKEAARDVRTSITCLFTFGWHLVDPWRTYTERAAKKVSSSCWPFPDANRLPLGH